MRVDRDMIRPTSNEISLNLEREITTGLSGRASWVYKNMRNVWGEIDVVREAGYTVPFTINDPGADRVVGTGDDQTFQTQALPAGTGTDRVYTNDERNDADFHTVEFAINRRFSGKWMMLTSFGYTWSTMVHTPPAARRIVRLSSVRPDVGRRRQGNRRRCGTTRSSAATCCRMTSASRDRGRCRAASTTPAPSA